MHAITTTHRRCCQRTWLLAVPVALRAANSQRHAGLAENAAGLPYYLLQLTTNNPRHTHCPSNGPSDRLLGRISSASPHRLQPKQGRKQGPAPGKPSPSHPRPPPGPTGATGGAKREPANGTPPAKAREPRASRNFQEMLDPKTRLAAFFSAAGEASVVHKLIAGVSAMTLATAPNVVRRSGVPPATYIRGNGGACQDFFLLSPVLKRPLPMRK